MKQVDYIIVGLGLSGLAFAEKLQQENKSFVVFNESKEVASKVAGGIINPVVLKRFNKAWKANELLPLAYEFYGKIAERLSVQLINKIPIYRRFNSIEEQNDWFVASDQIGLKPYLQSELVQGVSSIESSFKFGKVLQTGILDTEKLISNYIKSLKKLDVYFQEEFDYGQIQVETNSIHYKDFKAKQIIFCDGYGLSKNPFFNHLPLRGNKGEYLIIKSEELQLDFILKSSFFIIPLGNNLYKVGATYNRDFSNITSGEIARTQLSSFLNKILKVDYKIVDQVAGVRPTTKDRRPLVGRHSKFENVYVNNGYGSRGILLAPWVANELYSFIENNKALNSEIDINRFS